MIVFSKTNRVALQIGNYSIGTVHLHPFACITVLLGCFPLTACDRISDGHWPTFTDFINIARQTSESQKQS